MSERCDQRGTSTGTHWPGCRYGDQPSYARGTIKVRTESERDAYLEGFEAAIDAIKRHDLGFAEEVLRTTKKVIG